MDLPTSMLVMIIILVSGLALYLLAMRQRDADEISLRQLDAYATLGDHIGRAVESGRGVHFALGRGDLASSANPASLAALMSLDYLNRDACRSDVPPVVTVGDGTLVVAGQDSLRGAYGEAGRSHDYRGSMVRFLADKESSMAYAAGASELISEGNLGSNIMLGRFGPELGIIAEAAQRENMEQVAGSDDPVAISLSAAVTDKLLIGEELFAAGAYLEGRPIQVASLQLQDLLRILAAAGILIAALLGALTG